MSFLSRDVYCCIRCYFKCLILNWKLKTACNPQKLLIYANVKPTAIKNKNGLERQNKNKRINISQVLIRSWNPKVNSIKKKVKRKVRLSLICNHRSEEPNQPSKRPAKKSWQSAFQTKGPLTRRLSMSGDNRPTAKCKALRSYNNSDDWLVSNVN